MSIKIIPAVAVCLLYIGVALPAVRGDVPLQIITPSGITNPAAIVFDKDGNFFLSNYNGKSINKYSASGSLLVSYPLDARPFGITLDPSEQYLYAALPDAADVLKLNVSNGAVLANINVNGLSECYGVAVDENYLYLVSQYDLIRATLTGVIFNRYQYGQYNQLWGVTLVPASTNLFVSGEGVAFLVDKESGRALQTFTGSPNDNLWGNAVDSNGYFYSAEPTGSRVLQFDMKGNVVHYYDITDGNTGYPYDVAIEPGTGNVYVVDYYFNRIIIFAPFTPPLPSCTTGAAAGNIDLRLLSPSGDDVTGVDQSRTHLYVWSVCGTVKDEFCAKFAPNSSVCGLDLPITNGVVVARPPVTAITWSYLPITNTSKVVGVVGEVMNGDTCGRFNLPSQLLIILSCSGGVPINMFEVDDADVSPSASVCTYILTFHTPIVCTNNTGTQKQSFTE